MILQMFMVIFILGATLICNVIGTSYSNVYMERDIVPMRYYQYGTPYPSIANPRLSQINTLPSIPGYVTPCVSPCVYPAQTVATGTPVNHSANVLTYNSPVPNIAQVPIVVTSTKEEPTPYEYSYVVYDENTGDHKAQRELSDGSVVRGEYSFLQPDGYVREVQYVADDISGFNAVVRNFLPVAVEGKRKVEVKEQKESSPPCHEIKNESLKEGSQRDSAETSIKNHQRMHKTQPNDESNEKAKEYHHGKSKQSEEENSKEIHNKETKNVFIESVKGSDAKSSEKQHKEKQHIKQASEEESEEKSKENSEEETLHSKSKESTEESIQKHYKTAKTESKETEEDSIEEIVSEESKEALKEKTRTKSEDNKNKSIKGSKAATDKNSGEESVVLTNHGKHKEAHELLKPSDEVLVSYKDILRCIEAAMTRNYGVPAAMKQGPSPLTYIILNKPC